MNKEILWLPSWFPSRVDLYRGDFIRRHAEAASLYDRITVLYTETDETITRQQVIEEKVNENLVIYVCYFPRPTSFISKFINKSRKFFVLRKICNQIFSTKRPDIVHVHVPYKAGLIALWLKKRFNINYYVTEHWAGYDNANTDNFFSRPASFRHITKKILNNSKSVICVSEDLALKLSSIAPAIKTKVIPNTVNEKLFYYERNTHQRFKFIHHISSWKGQKNTEGLIKVFYEFHKIRQDWECIMYGPVQTDLTELVIKSGLVNHIKFTGEVSYNKVAEIVKSASVFISFSNYENQPCSILEALCCGVPVIATKVGGIPEIINSQNGILIDPKNELQLLQAIERIMEDFNNYNQQAIAEDSKNKFSFFAVGKQLSLLYHS